MISVVLADDQDLVRAGFRMILSVEDDIGVVAEAADGRAAVEQAVEHRPDLVLMDVQMPEMDGIEAAGQIVARTDCQVVILTTFEREDYLFAALEAGVSGFLLKNCEAEELVRAVRDVADGQALVAPEMTRHLIQRLAVAPRGPADTHVIDGLTERERDVLARMARGLSNTEIAAELVVGAATVKTHVSRVLMKLGARDRVQAVVLAHRAGLGPPRG